MLTLVYLITFLFVVLDFITGIFKAIAKKSFTSSVMREGLVHKTGSILCVGLGALCEYAIRYLDLGINVPIAISICTYIVIMELGSIIENLGEINPSIVPNKIKSFFTKLNGE